MPGYVTRMCGWASYTGLMPCSPSRIYTDTIRKIKAWPRAPSYRKKGNLNDCCVRPSFGSKPGASHPEMQKFVRTIGYRVSSCKNWEQLVSTKQLDVSNKCAKGSYQV